MLLQKQMVPSTQSLTLVTPFTGGSQTLQMAKPQTGCPRRDRDPGVAGIVPPHSTVLNVGVGRFIVITSAGTMCRARGGGGRFSIPSRTPYLYGDGALAGKRQSYRPDYARWNRWSGRPTGQRVIASPIWRSCSKNTPSAANISACGHCARTYVVRDMIAVAHEIATPVTIHRGAIATNR